MRNPVFAPYATSSAEADLLRQAELMRSMAAPFCAGVLDAAAHCLDRAPGVRTVLEDWGTDRSAAVPALRLNAGLHHLALTGQVPALSACYAALDLNCDAAVADALEQCDVELVDWLDRPTQTNEVGRSAATMAALRVVASRFHRTVEIVELGASAGLNLNLMHFGYDFGGQMAGDPASPLILRPRWTGAVPKGAAPRILRARGVDLAPLDVDDPNDCERLLAYVWADHRERGSRQRLALRIARSHGAEVASGDALEWLEKVLAEPRRAGITTCVVHTMFQQYLDAARQRELARLLEEAGRAATPTRPLARIALEWNPQRTEVRLQLTCWPGGQIETLAIADPYGSWICWLN